MTPKTLTPPGNTRNPRQPRGATIATTHTGLETHWRSGGGIPLDADQASSEAQRQRVGVDPLPTSQGPNELHGRRAGGESSTHPHPKRHSEPRGSADVGWVELRMFAELFADAQDARKAFDNKTRSGTVDPDYLAKIKAGVELAETEAKRAMLASYKRVVPKPIRDWQQATIGIGDHTLALLLGQTGHPCIAQPYHTEPNPDYDPDKPKGQTNLKTILIPDAPYTRKIGQLWAYCGRGDKTLKRTIGSTQEEALKGGNGRAKMVTFLLAKGCYMMDGRPSKSGGRRALSPYRVVADARRARTAETHPDWSPGHSLNDALNIAAKEILRDLWVAANTTLTPRFAGETQAADGGEAA